MEVLECHWREEYWSMIFLPIIEDSSQVNVRLFHSSNDLEKEVILEMDDLYTTHYDKENIVDVVSKIPDPVNTGGNSDYNGFRSVY